MVCGGTALSVSGILIIGATRSGDYYLREQSTHSSLILGS